MIRREYSRRQFLGDSSLGCERGRHTGRGEGIGTLGDGGRADLVEMATYS